MKAYPQSAPQKLLDGLNSWRSMCVCIKASFAVRRRGTTLLRLRRASAVAIWAMAKIVALLVIPTAILRVEEDEDSDEEAEATPAVCAEID